MKDAAAPPPTISLVLPCFNEKENLVPLVEEIHRTLDSLTSSYEILFVDDRSTDSSLEALLALRLQDPRVRVLAHRTNCGESAAQGTGFRAARGDTIITMDSDGQNDPADIPRLLEELKEADVVCGVRTRRNDDWVKRISSSVGNKVRNWLTSVRISDAGCTYRAIRRQALDELPVFNGMHRFLPTMLSLQGFRIKELRVNHRPRTSGVSKYGIGNRALRGLVDCLAMRWFQWRVVPAHRVDHAAGDPLK